MPTKELRRLEIKIIRHLQELKQIASGFGAKTEQLTFIPKSQLDLAASFEIELFSRIQLNQFYGIELDDFAHEIAQLSLWLTEHQMNMEFKREFGQSNPTLPLKDAGHIEHGNSCRIDWEDVCPRKDDDEIYILGNPPYLGSKEQDQFQKADMDFVFNGWTSYKKLDYISCWFKLGTDYIKNVNQKFAFVSTNSICQGEQVSLIWPYIFKNGSSIFFAHQSFHWSNNARGKAGVTCIIVGVSKIRSDVKKRLYNFTNVLTVENISPYLIPGSNLCVYPRENPLSDLPEMIRGSQPTDNGNLILSSRDLEDLKGYDAEKFVKRYMGADDFINNKERWCLWIKDNDLPDAETIPFIRERIEKCRSFRLKSKKEATRRKAISSHKFDEVKHQHSPSIIFPVISSHRRKYVPIGFLGPDIIISNKAQVVYGAEPFMFGILSSQMHMCWMKVTSSRMRNDYQYSKKLSYNTFPFPIISNNRNQEITQCVFRMLEEREKHPEKTLAELYDPDKMPESLREAHRANDIVIEKCYRARPFESDEERLEHLFKLYEKMVQEEKNKGTLFESQKKKRKKKHA